ncbi:Tic22 family protein [Moorena sp. SIO3H5]|uniref:Tic22 family protein n=1 Tax=Moorena sp. SIO3H5 TaxID=2607834 RepID=UPI0013B5E68C|nr:Tic22 family protein [Moorena sp. SIO3H5]NEO68623.1 hypothetical protein [Moorena sp. SIO3H5]
MKSLFRWGTTLSLVASALLGSVSAENLAALALTEEQITEKLRPVPVFAVTDNAGSPLVASIPDQQDQKKTTSVAGVFISQEDANAFVQRLKQENPELGNKVKVVPVSLGEVHEQNQKNRTVANGLNFAYIPNQQQVKQAQAIWNQNGQEEKPFQGVPLFVAKEASNSGYLTIQQNGVSSIPFFFNKEQLQSIVNRYKQQDPNSQVKIEVVPLEGVIQTLQKSNDQQLEKIVLVPSQESLKFLQSLSQNQLKSPNQ